MRFSACIATTLNQPQDLLVGISTVGAPSSSEFSQEPSCRQDFWDPIKYIPLGSGTWFLSIGGEAREAFEQVGNDNWGKQPYTNTFFLERYMLHTDWHLGKYVRAFVQLKSELESFRTGGPRPIDEKKLDFEAAFDEVGSATGDNWLFFRPAGRS